LVTGGAGFIGSHLVDALLEQGAKVRVLDDLSSGRRENLQGPLEAGKVELLVGDIRDLDLCRKAAAGCSTIFHQAARGSVPRSLEDPSGSLDINVRGTANIFTAARDEGAQRIVFASSSSVFGDSQTLPKREGEEGNPLSPYALSKWMNEELAAVYGRCYGLELVGLRYFNVYGPRQDPEGPYAAVVPRFFKAFLSGGRPQIFGDGEQSRDFTFVGDAVQANLRAALAPVSSCGRSYNVGGGRRVTVNELAEQISSLLAVPHAVDLLPPRAGDVLHSLASLDQTTPGIGYVPGVPLAEGLKRARTFYEKLYGAVAS